ALDDRLHIVATPEGTNVGKGEEGDQEGRDADENEGAHFDFTVRRTRGQRREQILLPQLLTFGASGALSGASLHTASITRSEPVPASRSRNARTRASSLFLNSPGVPTKRILPLSSMATRSEIGSAPSMSWVTTIEVTPSSRPSLSIS